MKKTLLIFGLGLLLTACSDDNASAVDDNTGPISTENKVLLLKVDMLTSTFEGGKELVFPDAGGFTISPEYLSPGDFGSIKLKYAETGGTIFDGTIIWNGLGEMHYPEALDAPGSFSVMDEEADMPALSQFETVNYVGEGEGFIPPAEIDYQSIWNAIDNLQQVEAYRTSNPDAKVHLFLYTPSVGIGDPHEWDWFVILKN